MRFVVTGGAGFIGRHLVKELAEGGNDVAVVDDLSNSRSGVAGEYGKTKGVRFTKADVTREDPAVSRAFQGAEVVVHLAAIVSVERSVREPMLTFMTNVAGTANALAVSLKSGARQFVLASSASVYGGSAPPLKEGLPLEPLSPYAASKVASEALCRSYTGSFGLKTTVLRMMNVYGPGQEAGVMAEFAKSVSRGKPPKVYGEGSQSRDFVNVRDVVAAIRLAAKSPGVGGTFNIGTGRAVSINELAEDFIELSGFRRLAVDHAPPRQGEVAKSFADISLAKKMLGYEPTVKLEDGVREYYRWFTARGEP